MQLPLGIPSLMTYQQNRTCGVLFIGWLTHEHLANMWPGSKHSIDWCFFRITVMQNETKRVGGLWLMHQQMMCQKPPQKISVWFHTVWHWSRCWQRRWYSNLSDACACALLLLLYIFLDSAYRRRHLREQPCLLLFLNSTSSSRHFQFHLICLHSSAPLSFHNLPFSPANVQKSERLVLFCVVWIGLILRERWRWLFFCALNDALQKPSQEDRDERSLSLGKKQTKRTCGKLLCLM